MGKKETNSKCLELADNICQKLLAQGLIIYRYDASSTNSIYLKLDYGVCNSIRISDHVGKGYLKYRYNIGTDIKKITTQMDTFERHYYPAEKVDALVAAILADRAAKQNRYGMKRYKQFMRENQRSHAESPGFWQTARQVFAKREA